MKDALLERSIFSLNNDIFRRGKIMNIADKNWALFQKIKDFKNYVMFSKNVINISWSPNQILFTEKSFWKDLTNFTPHC